MLIGSAKGCCPERKRPRLGGKGRPGSRFFKPPAAVQAA
jgi:hypothetical protein